MNKIDFLHAIGFKPFETSTHFRSTSEASESEKRGEKLYEKLSEKPLVNPAKSRSHFSQHINTETGEITSFQADFNIEEIIRLYSGGRISS